MKKMLILFLFVFLLSLIANRYNSRPEVIIAKLLNTTGIRAGELRYSIQLFGVIPAGEAVFYPEKIEEYNRQEVYHLRADASSSKLLSGFFKFHAVFDSYVDKKRLSPVLFKESLAVSGKDTLEKEVLYDQAAGVMTLAGLKRKIMPDTQDPLSAIFNIRRMDFNKNDNFEISINTNQKNYVLEGSGKIEELSISRQKYKVIFLKSNIRRRDKNPYHKSNVDMVLLEAEGNNIPVLIKVFASGAFIEARLIDIK